MAKVDHMEQSLEEEQLFAMAGYLFCVVRVASDHSSISPAKGAVSVQEAILVLAKRWIEQKVTRRRHCKKVRHVVKVRDAKSASPHRFVPGRSCWVLQQQ